MRTGRVLLYAAEDALHVVRQRLAGIAAAVGRDLADLDIHVITCPSVRLDLAADRDALAETVAALEPTLLVLDPFVRLHRIDENVSGEVAPLLAYQRELQRHFHVRRARPSGRVPNASRGCTDTCSRKLLQSWQLCARGFFLKRTRALRSQNRRAVSIPLSAQRSPRGANNPLLKDTKMNKNQKLTDRAPKKLTIEDLKRVIGGTANLVDPTVEGDVVEDTGGNKAAGPDSKAG